MNNILPITKKQFKNDLINNTTEFFCISNKKCLTEILTILQKYDFSNFDFLAQDTRKVEKVQTNAVMFTNKSWLYLDQATQKCFKFNNYLILIDSYFDEYSNEYYSKLLVYKIVEG